MKTGTKSRDSVPVVLSGACWGTLWLCGVPRLLRCAGWGTKWHSGVPQLQINLYWGTNLPRNVPQSHRSASWGMNHMQNVPQSGARNVSVGKKTALFHQCLQLFCHLRCKYKVIQFRAVGVKDLLVASFP